MKLELGSLAKRDGWTTMDVDGGCDIQHDLMKPLPFPDNSIEQIYSSHLLEHFSFPDMIKLLKECYRILIPNGMFDACVPNMRPFIEAYFKPEGSFEWLPDYRVFHYFSRIDWINYMGYLDGIHKWMFDDENLPLIIASVGFRNVRSREYKEGLDMPHRKHESVYVEGIK